MIRPALIAALMFVAASAGAQTPNVPPERPFTLLLITQDGPDAGVQGFGRNPVDTAMRRMIYSPQTQQMQRWAAWASPKELGAALPITRESHADILRDAKALPALALIDSMSGARWHLMSGDTLPSSEYELARQLDVYFAATMQAAANSRPDAVRQMTPTQLLQAKTAGGPKPFQPSVGGGLLNPQINPQINIPDGFDASANLNTSVDEETQRFVMVVVFIFAIAVVSAAWILGRALTNKETE